MTRSEILLRLNSVFDLLCLFAWIEVLFFTLYRKGKIKLRPEAQKRFEKLNIERETQRAKRVGWITLGLSVATTAAWAWLES